MKKTNRTDPNLIGNRIKRSQVARRHIVEKRKEQKKARKERQRKYEEWQERRAERKASVSGRGKAGKDDEDEDDGSDSGGEGSDADDSSDGSAPPEKLVPKTIDTEREHDETVVQEGDEEVEADEAMDEFAKYFRSEEENPKLLLTTSRKPSARCYAFMMELVRLFPGVEFYPRGTYEVKKIVQYANNRNFSNVMILNEDSKKVNGMWLVHLPEGPTAKFKFSGLVMKDRLGNTARPSDHIPEVILNNFSTRLGHTVGRMLASLFPPRPEFEGRRVVTFHNQRDFIFVRHHRYIFENGKRARLQESGPRFTLKLRSLQHGTFDTKSGEYEWIHKREMDTSRRRFFL